MARKILETLIDDLDGLEADETIEFSLDGKSFTIDLSSKNADKFRSTLAPYMAAGRSTGARRQESRRTARGASRDYSLSALREWAAEKEIAVPARGRIPQAIIEQYRDSLQRESSSR